MNVLKDSVPAVKFVLIPMEAILAIVWMVILWTVMTTCVLVSFKISYGTMNNCNL